MMRNDANDEVERRSTEPIIEQMVEQWTTQYGLTRMQRKILNDAAHGVARTDIARMHGITVKTVKRHINALLKRTGDAHLYDAVARLLREVIQQKISATSPVTRTSLPLHSVVLR